MYEIDAEKLYFKYILHVYVIFQGLTETKGELKRKEQTLRQLNRQVISLEGEKKAFLTNIADAEKALRTVARYA